VAEAIEATSAVTQRPTLRVKPSMGQGAWATIPWIALLDKTEGQITKLKAIKRSMYGRAKFDLLRRRALCAA
jgi:hypothetical protein